MSNTGSGTSKSQRAHARTDARKKARQEQNEAQRQGNVILERSGEPIPWEAAKAARAKRRAQERKDAQKVGGES